MPELRYGIGPGRYTVCLAPTYGQEPTASCYYDNRHGDCDGGGDDDADALTACNLHIGFLSVGHMPMRNLDDRFWHEREVLTRAANVG
jgi:hypothetical protein